MRDPLFLSASATFLKNLMQSSNMPEDSDKKESELERRARELEEGRYSD